MDTNQENLSSSEKKNFDVQEKLGKAELFLDNNKKIVWIIVGVVSVIVAGVVGYKYWYLPDVEQSAQKAAFYSFMNFEKDSLNLAIKGGEKIRTSDNKNITTLGLQKIEEEFSGTKTANLATYQLGCVYMKQGKFQSAIEKFEEFSSDDAIVSAIAMGAIGDCYVELKKPEDGVKYYLKAADKNPNNFTTPIFLKKAGMTSEYLKKYSEAVGIYERIQKEYGKTQEGRDITKYITRAKLLGNLN